MSDTAKYKEMYDREHERVCELSCLIDALGVSADDLGGTPIADRELASRRNAICGIARAMAKVAELPQGGHVH